MLVHADRTRATKYSDIEKGDKVLLKQARENKFSPEDEPEPYIVTRKERNAVVQQDSNGNSKMRNVAHTKTFVEPKAPLQGKKNLPSNKLERSEQLEQDQPIQTPVSKQRHQRSLHPVPMKSLAR